MKTKQFLDLFNVVKDWKSAAAMFRDPEYRIPLGRKFIYAFLIIYIIVPFDFIPGIFPIIGMVDDLGAFGAIIGVLLYEIVAYRDFCAERLQKKRLSGNGTEKKNDKTTGHKPNETAKSNERPR
jgi:uncharacterized membrane protein YkvA (DUF1232 family)